MAAWLTVAAKAVLKAAVAAAKTEFWKQAAGKGAEIVATFVSALIERLRSPAAGGDAVNAAASSPAETSDPQAKQP